MRFFRESSLEQLPVSIAGIKLGDRVLMLGCGDPKLIAQLALKTGLTGRPCAVDEDAGRAERAAGIIAREGALVETVTAPFTTLPLDSETFDVAVVRNVLGTLDVSRRTGAVAEILRVLRPGGRCLIIDSMPRGRLGRLLSRHRTQSDYDAQRALDTVAFRAVRTVADRDGMLFVEGVKENVSR